MSHTFNSPGGLTRIHYNSDMSGIAQIIQRSEDGASVEQVQVPAADLVLFVAQWVETEKATALEQAEPHEILGIPKSSMP